MKETNAGELYEAMGGRFRMYVCVCVCRIVVEDTYVKSLSKLQKSVQHIPENSLG